MGTNCTDITKGKWVAVFMDGVMKLTHGLTHIEKYQNIANMAIAIPLHPGSSFFLNEKKNPKKSGLMYPR
jgi:hypothetical protein